MHMQRNCTNTCLCLTQYRYNDLPSKKEEKLSHSD